MGLRAWHAVRVLSGPPRTLSNREVSLRLPKGPQLAGSDVICEAVTRANMRFVATKTPEQQSCLMLHRTRHLFIRQQTAVINSIRAHLAEFGIVAPVGRQGVEQLLGIVADAHDKRLPEIARACVAALGAQLRMLKARFCNSTV